MSRSPLGGSAPVVEAWQALRGVQLTVAVTTVAALGDLTHFDHPGRLMNDLGLTPSKYASGERDARSVAKTGIPMPSGSGAGPRPLATRPRSVEHLPLRLEKLPKPIQDVSWKAQVRRCKRYRQLSARGKNPIRS